MKLHGSMIKQLRIAQFWLLLLFCSYLSLTPAPPLLLQNSPDKLLHAGGYLGLYLSYSLAYSLPARTLHKLLFLLGYSALIEILQHFIPRRGFSWLDILANAAGLLLGLLLVEIVKTCTRYVKTGR